MLFVTFRLQHYLEGFIVAPLNSRGSQMVIISKLHNEIILNYHKFQHDNCLKVRITYLLIDAWLILDLNGTINISLLKSCTYHLTQLFDS